MLNPYAIVRSSDIHESQSRLHCYSRPFAFAGSWVSGTFFLSILTTLDLVLNLEIPGGFIYLAMLVGPGIALVTLVISRLPSKKCWLLCPLSIALQPVQLVVWGYFFLSTGGFEGIQ